MSSSAIPPAPKKILVIDDDSKLLFGLKAFMTRKGYEVFSTTNGSEGYKLAMEHKPDIILCDITMPPPNGFNLKRMLTADPQTNEIPFIFLSSRTSIADRIAGLQQGADDYITKPFNIDELEVRIEAILRRVEIGRQHGLHEMEEALAKIQQGIMNNFGHELSTPLTVILANLETALREKFPENSRDRNWYLENCLKSANSLSSLVEDMVLLSDIDRGTISSKNASVSLDTAFKNYLQSICAHYEERKLDLRISLEDGLIISIPEAWFYRAIYHLVDNACKFSPEKGTVWIKVSRNGQGSCTIIIENEGEIIPADLREKVFERYYQADQGNKRPQSGLGIGLTIARAVAESCGGSVEILDSEIGCRTRMTCPCAS